MHMDRLLDIVVRVLVRISAWAKPLSKLGLVRYSEMQPNAPIRFLLVGYNGAGNTGADVRTAEIARIVQERFAERAQVTVMTLDRNATDCYFPNGIESLQFSSLYPFATLRACTAHDVVILCEGSTLKSKFANALTLFFAEAAGIMKAQGKPCIALGSEAGDMDAFLERTVRKEFSEVQFIARSKASYERVVDLGLKAFEGTDAAWDFQVAESDRAVVNEQLHSDGWDGSSPLLGVAAINPFCWPVKPSLAKTVRAAVTRDWSQNFAKWYFFSESPERDRAFDAYINALAEVVNAHYEKTGCHVVLLGMERLDERACRKLSGLIRAPHSIFLAREHNAYRMTAVLRSLSLLITSRYHANVLSMPAGVPTVAVSMDERLQNTMDEVGLSEHLLLRTDDAQLVEHLLASIAYIDANEDAIQRRLMKAAEQYRNDMFDMMALMEQMVRESEAACLQAAAAVGEAHGQSVSSVPSQTRPAYAPEMADAPSSGLSVEQSRLREACAAACGPLGK